MIGIRGDINSRACQVVSRPIINTGFVQFEQRNYDESFNQRRLFRLRPNGPPFNCSFALSSLLTNKNLSHTLPAVWHVSATYRSTCRGHNKPTRAELSLEKISSDIRFVNRITSRGRRGANIFAENLLETVRCMVGRWRQEFTYFFETVWLLRIHKSCRRSDISAGIIGTGMRIFFINGEDEKMGNGKQCVARREVSRRSV